MRWPLALGVAGLAEQRRQQVDELFAAFALRVVERMRRAVEEFLGQRLRQRFEHQRRIVATREHALSAFQFTLAQRFSLRVQSADERRHEVFGVRVRVAQPDKPSERVFKAGMAADVLIPLRETP